MKESIREALKNELPQADYPRFQPGDKIRVETSEDIGGQMRQRFFEGICIDRKGEGIDRSFTVRKDSFGVGVERVFSLHSPTIQSIKIIRKGVVRRANLKYLAEKSTKEARIKERRVDIEELNRNSSGKTEAPPETAGEDSSVDPEAEEQAEIAADETGETDEE